MAVYDEICTVYSVVPLVNTGDTPESGWIHLKVGIHCVLFLIGRPNKDLLYPFQPQGFGGYGSKSGDKLFTYPLSNFL